MDVGEPGKSVPITTTSGGLTPGTVANGSGPDLNVASGVIGQGVTGIQERVKQGFRMVGLGSESRIMSLRG